MEKIDLELREIEAHKQMKALEQFLKRFNLKTHKATDYERFMLGVMLNKLEWVIDNCLEDKE